MVRFRFGSGCRVQLAVMLVASIVGMAAQPAHARQVLFVVNGGNNTVGEYNAVTGAAINATFINGQGLSEPEYMALDGNNHLFVTSAFTNGPNPANSVGQYNATTGGTINANLTAAGFNFGLAADNNNHLFLSSYFSGIFQYDETTGAVNTNFIYIPTSYGPGAIALDGNNHMYLPIINAGNVAEYNATTGATLNALLISGLNHPVQVAVDGHNHLFVTYGGYTLPDGDSGLGNILGEYDATTGAPINVALITSPTALGFLALDGAGHIFTSYYTNSAVAEYDATTGALINPAFITGLAQPEDLVFMAPVPEPSSLLLLTAATAAAICRRRVSAACGTLSP